MLKRVCTFLFLAIVFISCGTKGKTFRIGIDPTFYPASLGGKEVNVYAFSKELLHAISHEEGVFFEMVTTAWDRLIFGLKEKQYDGMLSSVMPRINLQNIYIFSDPYIYTGPVLVVKQAMKINHLKHLKGKEIGVGSLNQETFLIEKYFGFNIHYYHSIPEAIEEIVSNQIDGVLIDYLQATGYVHHFYRDQLKIATPPLNETGLRLILLKEGDQELVEIFNRGLDKLRDNGIYEKLLKKWELN